LMRFLEHVVCSEVAGVGGEFGPFPCRIRRWPNMKFVKLGQIYIYYLRVTAIRVVDQ